MRFKLVNIQDLVPGKLYKVDLGFMITIYEYRNRADEGPKFYRTEKAYKKYTPEMVDVMQRQGYRLGGRTSLREVRTIWEILPSTILVLRRKLCD